LNDAIQYDRYRYETKIHQISIGKKYLKRSDDASATDEIARIKNESSKTVQWGDNLDLAYNWEVANGSRIENILDSVHRVRELSVEANSGTLDPVSRENISKELDGLLQTLIEDGNVSYVGTPMFAGKGLKPPQPVEWEKISTSHVPYATYTDKSRPYKKFNVDNGMPASGFKNLNETEFNTWSATRHVAANADDYQDYNPGWDTDNNRPNPWRPGNTPKSGELGMPAAGGHEWEELTQTEYNDWANAQPVGAYKPGWDTANSQPNAWEPGREPLAGETGMPVGGKTWDDLTETEFDDWLDNTEGGYYYTKPPLSRPPTAAEKTAFKAEVWDTAKNKPKQWDYFSTDPEPTKPYPPVDLGMPSDHDWRYLTKEEYESWKEANPASIDPGWYEDKSVNPPINGHTRQWPAPKAPIPGQSPVSGVYDPNLGMPSLPVEMGGHSWDELTPDEYMDWREAQLADAGREDFFDPGWDPINKHPNPWPRTQPQPVTGMTGMPSGHSWEELTEDEFNDWAEYNNDDDNYLRYKWDGTDNTSNLDPHASGFKDKFFFDPKGRTFQALYEDPDDPTKITGVKYNGSENPRSTQMAENNTDTNYGMVGEGPNGLFVSKKADGTEDINVFDAIIRLRDALASGNQPSEGDLQPIQDIDDHMAGRLVETSVNQKKLEGMKNIAFTTQTSLENRLSDIEDLDVAFAASELSALQSAFQASLQLVNRVNSMQLLDYI
jgi:flagellin-like hook-associated protein FlgL